MREAWLSGNVAGDAAVTASLWIVEWVFLLKRVDWIRLMDVYWRVSRLVRASGRYIKDIQISLLIFRR